MAYLCQIKETSSKGCISSDQNLYRLEILIVLIVQILLKKNHKPKAFNNSNVSDIRIRLSGYPT